MVIVETMYKQHKSSVIYLSIKDDNHQGIGDYEAGHDKLKIALYILSYIILILANAVADSILIHRCYVTWGSRRHVAVPLAILSCAITVVTTIGTAMFIGFGNTSIKTNQALASEGDAIVATSLVIGVSFNLALTLLTAGRIWWIARTLKPSKTRAVRTINKIILESGMIYPLIMILHLSMVNSRNLALFNTFPLVILSAGIAPTLIIVLTCLTIRVVEDLDVNYSHTNNLASIRLTEQSYNLSRGLRGPHAPSTRDGTKVVAQNN
ncbi:hypothetical protein PM082_013721 [Marasmius tenuissimus]|nr:hypothetical protein PM082_013721 [Marasmius tenuissimus]